MTAGDDLAPLADLIGLAGQDRLTRDLLGFAWERRNVTDPAGFSWPQMLGYVPEGVRGAVDHFLGLVGYLGQWEQAGEVERMKLRLGIVEQLWRLRHTDSPCLPSVALADSVDDIHGCDGILCSDCRRAA